LNPKPTHFPPKKKACTYQHVLIMEGGEMEADVTMQQDDESI